MNHILKSNKKPSRIYHDSVRWLTENVGPIIDQEFKSAAHEATAEQEMEAEFQNHYELIPFQYISTFSYCVGKGWRCMFARTEIMYVHDVSAKDHLLVSIEDDLLATQYRLSF